MCSPAFFAALEVEIIKRLLFVLFIVLLLTVIYGSSSEIYTASDNIKVLNEQEYSLIILAANQTTGFEWHYEVVDEDKLEVVFDIYNEHKSAPGEDGVGGDRIICIRGLKKGKTVIEFELFQPWIAEEVIDRNKYKIYVGAKEE